MFMKLTKKSALMAAVLVVVSSFGVWAECGDSVCGNYGGQFSCAVDDGAGNIRLCNQDSPCSIRC